MHSHQLSGLIGTTIPPVHTHMACWNGEKHAKPLVSAVLSMRTRRASRTREASHCSALPSFFLDVPAIFVFAASCSPAAHSQQSGSGEVLPAFSEHSPAHFYLISTVEPRPISFHARQVLAATCPEHQRFQARPTSRTRGWKGLQ